MKFFTKLMVAGVLLCMFMAATQVSAVEPPSNPIVKLGRGVANVAFGPLELLIRPYDVNHNQGGIAALTYGVFDGIVCTVMREAVGVFEIVTFLMPLPGCNDDPVDSDHWGYGPILYPAWVIDTQHDAFNFVFPKDAIIAP